MSVSLVIPHTIAAEIQAVAGLDIETAGVMLAGIAHAPGGALRILARSIRWAKPSSYYRRDWNAMSICPEGYIEALSEGERTNAVCLWVHTHPGLESHPTPSCHDHKVDDQLAELFRIRTGRPYYGALIFSPRNSSLAFTGHIQREGNEVRHIDRLWQVGDQWRLIRAFDSDRTSLAPVFDRNVRAFGENVQRTLGELKVAVVGCGGTGSCVAEQLARLGIRHFTLIDADVLTETNVTRVYGSTIASVGQPKVKVLGNHIRTFAPNAQINEVQSMLTMESTARQLIDSDVVFGCTDDNAGRLVLSRLATYLLTPIIDCGILISSDASDNLLGIDGRITILSAGNACLICRNRIDLARASAELLTPTERKRREDEGYAPALSRTEPAVVAYTTFVAATAVCEFLERLIGYGQNPRPSEILARIHDRELSTNIALPRKGHYCHLESGKMALGVTQPFLEQTWPT